MLFNEPKLLKRFDRLRVVEPDRVSVLFNEPKLLKSQRSSPDARRSRGFSALQRAEIAEMQPHHAAARRSRVSVLFNEPKLLKGTTPSVRSCRLQRFSALQRAEIAESRYCARNDPSRRGFSALQRAEIAEMPAPRARSGQAVRFQCSSTSRNC